MSNPEFLIREVELSAREFRFSRDKNIPRHGNGFLSSRRIETRATLHEPCPPGWEFSLASTEVAALIIFGAIFSVLCFLMSVRKDPSVNNPSGFRDPDRSTLEHGH